MAIHPSLVLVVAAVALGCGKQKKEEATPAQESESQAEQPTFEEAPDGDDEAAGAAEIDESSLRPPVSDVLSAVPPEIARVVGIETVVGGLERPVGVEHPPGDDARLFVVEQVGRIRILEDGELRPKPFFDIRGKVSRANEQGLLGLAFHPDFEDNGKLYVNYTARRGTTRVVEYQVSDENPNVVAMDTAREIFSLAQPFANHNGGYLEFGPDGKLYVGTGDGGAANDPLGAGQDDDNLLAKMLRFDVDARDPKPEIVQKGLRNPWRYAFDPENGDLYIADVGQNKWEYVYVVAGDDLDGHNFGWNVVEGNHCFAEEDCDASQFTAAVVEYPHSEGCSITGGEVYRGDALPELSGVYFYADFCTTLFRSFRWSAGGIRDHWNWQPVIDPKNRLNTISAFGTDAAGELYFTLLDGELVRFVRK